MAEKLKTRPSRITDATIEALQEDERRARRPIMELSVANTMILAGFTEQDVISVLGYMPDLNVRLEDMPGYGTGYGTAS